MTVSNIGNIGNIGSGGAGANISTSNTGDISNDNRAASRPFDAVIIGAGPAGSAAAILLARAGWAVALVERQTFPRRKVCGECIAASNLPLLAHLGIADAFEAKAGRELRQVALLHGSYAVKADLPAAPHSRYAWGRALGRETLDTLLLAQARAAGATVLQPWSVQAIQGGPGAWHCELRALDSTAVQRLRSPLLIDAHGAWEALPSGRMQRQHQQPPRRRGHTRADLFAFKATFTGATHPADTISVLALDGGYGGMVVADGGVLTLACCIRRDRLSQLRGKAPGLRAGDAVQNWLTQECGGIEQALQGATREGHWLAAGPIDPGVRVAAGDEMFCIGNAAGEAHPILGEGISMALQSAALLCRHLLGEPDSRAPTAALQAVLQRRYATDWQREFGPRVRLAAAFAHAAMHRRSALLLMALAKRWPALLTSGARWGGKVRQVHDGGIPASPPGVASAPKMSIVPPVPPFPPLPASPPTPLTLPARAVPAIAPHTS